MGFESEFVVVKATSVAIWARAKTESTGYNVDSDVAGTANQIQAFQSDGFQIGNDAAVNANGFTYMYMAWRQNDVPLFVTTTADTLNGTTTSINNLRANQGADSAISLREAITAANATRNVNGDVDEINFAISGSGVRTITLASTLPFLSDAVKIDAWTQSGWNNSPLIELNGNGNSSFGFALGHDQRWKHCSWFYHQSSYAWHLCHQLGQLDDRGELDWFEQHRDCRICKCGLRHFRPMEYRTDDRRNERCQQECDFGQWLARDNTL